ncbi:MAG: hypothetical protein QGF53_02420, partial [Alphaproteobacteria bacterium]|nr:hypothetical protein [Alphaproteobacteria bacterium]
MPAASLAQPSGNAAPGRHGRQRVGGGEPDHAGLGRHHGVVIHGPAVIAAADRRHGHRDLPGARDGLLHGEGGGDLAHGIVAVDNQRRALVARQSRASAGIDALDRQLGDIVGNAQGAVAMDTAQVGGDERVRQQGGIGLVHTAGGEHRTDHIAERASPDPRFPLALWIAGHGSYGMGME